MIRVVKFPVFSYNLSIRDRKNGALNYYFYHSSRLDFVERVDE